MALFTLVYLSVATHEMSDTELLALLEKSREKNKHLNITGMLLYLEDYFIQVLEGEQDKVDTLFVEIQKDKRHTNVLAIYENEIEERVFADWSMGFNRVGKEEFAQFEGYHILAEEHNFAEHPQHVLKLLESFRNRSYF